MKQYLSHESFGEPGSRVHLLETPKTHRFLAECREGGRRRRLSLKALTIEEARKEAKSLSLGRSAGKDRGITLSAFSVHRKGYLIYVIQRGEDGPVKIGITTNVGSRLKALQTANAEKLHVLQTITLTDFEKVIHRRLRRTVGLEGEWFSPQCLHALREWLA